MDIGVLNTGQLLPDLIYQKLRMDILNGALQRGQLLRQEELARSLNVSRVPLREAMSRLEADGLLVLRPRRGYAVNSLDQAAIIEIFDLRALIEEHAGFIAAHARTDEDVDAVGELVLQMESLDAGKKDYLQQWFGYNRAFHARIIASSRRSRVAKLAGNLLDSVEPYIRAEAERRTTGNVWHSHQEHREMLEAFLARDARGLAHLSRIHVEKVGERLVAAMRRNAGWDNPKNA